MFDTHKLMLSNDEVATELQCDQILKVLYDFMWKTIKLNDEAIREQLEQKGIKLSKKQVFAVLCILKLEEFATSSIENIGNNIDDVTWAISFNGFGFINTDTFVKRAKKRKIETGIKSFSFYTRWIAFLLPLLFSIVALLISYYALKKLS